MATREEFIAKMTEYYNSAECESDESFDQFMVSHKKLLSAMFYILSKHSGDTIREECSEGAMELFKLATILYLSQATSILYDGHPLFDQDFIEYSYRPMLELLDYLSERDADITGEPMYPYYVSIDFFPDDFEPELSQEEEESLDEPFEDMWFFACKHSSSIARCDGVIIGLVESDDFDRGSIIPKDVIANAWRDCDEQGEGKYPPYEYFNPICLLSEYEEKHLDDLRDRDGRVAPDKCPSWNYI